MRRTAPAPAAQRSQTAGGRGGLVRARDFPTSATLTRTIMSDAAILDGEFLLTVENFETFFSSNFMSDAVE